ncbi:MAG: hypothetical protein QM754_10140 [Tepidisphaeraceae bacterium]
MSLVWDLFTNTIEAAGVLGADADFIATLEEALAKLDVPRVLPDGRVAEWSHDFADEQVNHRHVSHLLAVHPGRQWATDERMLAAARKSLEVRGNASTGWSLAWKINLWARLGDGEQAWDCVRILQTPVTTTSTSFAGGLYLNLFDAHPPFQIERELRLRQRRLRDAPAEPRRRNPPAAGAPERLAGRGCDGSAGAGRRDGRPRLAGRQIVVGGAAEPG